jgi:hypothetical protein
MSQSLRRKYDSLLSGFVAHHGAMRTTNTQRAIDFVHREGRVLERRIVAAAFGQEPPDGVAAALRAYQNPDGGFGYGLEPDKRAPDSQPLDLEIAWQSLDWAGSAPHDLVGPACDHLATLGPGVSCVTPAVQDHPHAPHWNERFDPPGLNPTAGLAGFLWKWAVDHPWRAAATEFCWKALEEAPPDEAHTAIGVLRFLEHVPERDRAARVVEALRPTLPTMAMLHYHPGMDGYGVNPLLLVPVPGGPWADLFPGTIVDGHLDELEKTQSADGGWEISWPTIGPAAVSEWRGRLTLQYLLVLRAYGRLD